MIDPISILLQAISLYQNRASGKVFKQFLDEFRNARSMLDQMIINGDNKIDKVEVLADKIQCLLESASLDSSQIISLKENLKSQVSAQTIPPSSARNLSQCSTCGTMNRIENTFGCYICNRNFLCSCHQVDKECIECFRKRVNIVLEKLRKLSLSSCAACGRNVFPAKISADRRHLEYHENKWKLVHRSSGWLFKFLDVISGGYGNKSDRAHDGFNEFYTFPCGHSICRSCLLVIRVRWSFIKRILCVQRPKCKRFYSDKRKYHRDDLKNYFETRFLKSLQLEGVIESTFKLLESSTDIELI